MNGKISNCLRRYLWDGMKEKNVACLKIAASIRRVAMAWHYTLTGIKDRAKVWLSPTARYVQAR